ncbi:hypothetical protein J7T55_007991 [Diaporthe amygdali]|uniref:uncharacterized protein n=1 Tax=Phomopsis amygdali TaxID=1214568 RepID=UPI0022FE5BE8|nr:uncharacterized protein J7T55_007991 [Diaporthe amygdali]KAJ0114157.1 hypothetical protein J7T55_007991 [Diaporthe amygdali]
MELLLLWSWVVGVALADPMDFLPELRSRQVDGAASGNVFLRRASHSSAVLNGKVYIDGGEFSYTSGKGVVIQYSSTLLSIHLSADFEPDTVIYTAIAKPSGVPDLNYAGIWVNKVSNLLYTGFAGLPSDFGDAPKISQGLWSFEPSEDGTTGTWTNLNDTTDEYFMTQPRHFAGPVTSGNGAGFFLGGKMLDNGTKVPVSGLLKYNFATKVATNSTVVGISTSGYLQLGRMQYVPNFGPAGVIIAAGGHQLQNGPSEKYLLSFTSVQVFDPATDTWYEQTTTGDIPNGRKEYCMTGAASSNNTYEILVYAGWDGNLGTTSIAWDQAFVLSLPSFRWFKADYQALQPRHGLTCEHIGGGQVLTIGGVDTTQVGPDSLYDGVFNTRDAHAQGLAVFDLSSLSFKTRYMSNQTVYNLAPDVQSYYDNHDRMADFTYAGLADIFTVENFTAAATDDTGLGVSSSGATDSKNDSNPSSGPSDSSSDSEISAGVIAGSVVGGVAGAALIGTNIEDVGVGEQTYCGPDGHDVLCGDVAHAEMPGQVPQKSEVVSMPQAELPVSHSFDRPTTRGWPAPGSLYGRPPGHGSLPRAKSDDEDQMHYNSF